MYMGSLFAIAIATEGAIKYTAPIYKAAKTMGASGNKLFLKVIIPAALSEYSFWTKAGLGIRLEIPYSWRDDSINYKV